MRIKDELLRPISNAKIDLVLCMIDFFDHCVDESAVVEDLLCTVMQVSGEAWNDHFTAWLFRGFHRLRLGID
jgi:hypothetical protein